MKKFDVNEYKKSLNGKRILVVGLGKSGMAVLEVLKDLGSHLYVQDSEEEEKFKVESIKSLKELCQKLYLGKEPDGDLLDKLDLVVMSPGVPTDLDFVQRATASGAELIGELELAYRLTEGKFVAITGTNGKTTTTSLVGKIFETAGIESCVVGNIGLPVILEAEKMSSEGWLIAEVSSFQLETTSKFEPEISCILNLSPDHLDRHKTMENYGKAKAKVFENQKKGAFCIANRDDEDSYKLVCDSCKAEIVHFSRKVRPEHGAFLEEDHLKFCDREGRVFDICHRDELNIIGDHNVENALAAIAMGFCAGISEDDIRKAVTDFQAVEHRLEPVGSIRNIKFINDSKGTNPDSSIKAIEAVGKNIQLIAGGYDKSADFAEFIGYFEGRVKALFLLGATAEQLRRQAWKQGFVNIYMCENLEECVRKAFETGEDGDNILLSPACASWGMYKSFEERGKDFKHIFEELKAENV